MKLIRILFLLLAFVAVAPAAHGASPAMQRTLARLAATTGLFTFAVLSDSRSGDRVYAKVIGQLMLRQPLFVVSAGDVIVHSGDREHWKHFREISRPITVPYFLTPGNHDIDDEQSAAVWRDEVDRPGDEMYYAFTVGKNLFVILNSFDPATEFRVAGRQFDWLARTLDPARYEHQFVFVHHPLFMWKGATHEGEAQDRFPADRDRLSDLLVQKKVDIVFSGHEHTYRRIEKGGVAFVVTGGGGQTLYGKGSFNHGIVLQVDGPRVGAKVIDRDGVLRDEFVMQRP